MSVNRGTSALFASGIGCAVLIAGCCSCEPTGSGDPPAATEGASASHGVRRVPNVAHQKCVEDGYEVEAIEENGIPIGAECVDRRTGRRCEVWAYYRGECRLSEETADGDAESAPAPNE